jgi:FMN-dependent oxidoreductase (nitrilotriacetate monooxygenase family)
MTKARQTMRLSLFINPTGHHQASWRHPRADADAGINLGHYRALVQAAERAKFDMVFFADNQLVRPGPAKAIGRLAQYVANFEPLTLAANLFGATERIGLAATATTSYSLPFQVARKFASLDFISGGRIGWNMVTSGMEEECLNFDRDNHFDHEEAYQRAREFAEVCLGLWDSWEDDAFQRDKDSGIFSDQDKMYILGHKGAHFKVRGPLNIPRSPQARPVLLQAGMSEDGLDFATRYADLVFVMPQTLEDARKLYADIKTRAAAHGRNPDHVNVMPGISYTTGATEADAQREFEMLQSLLHPDVTIQALSQKMRADMSIYPLDEPLPDEIPSSRYNSRIALYQQMAKRENLTLLQLALRAASTGGAGLVVCDSGAHLADMMEEWFMAGAADGFQIQPSFLPGGFDDFLTHVHPLLRARGLVRAEYDGHSLRDHLGLPRPNRDESRFAARA